MSRRRKDPLRDLTEDERASLEQLGRATSAPAALVTRARALLAVADGCSYTEAARRVVVPHGAGTAAAQARRGRSPRSGRDGKKGLIEQAYTQTELPVWTQDEAGPYQAIPQPGARWRPTTSPARYPHEHIRHGTAKLLTLFHPASGQVRVKGVTSAANAVLHPWLEAELTAILATLPE